jgi:hypothetical protein
MRKCRVAQKAAEAGDLPCSAHADAPSPPPPSVETLQKMQSWQGGHQDWAVAPLFVQGAKGKMGLIEAIDTMSPDHHVT